MMVVSSNYVAGVNCDVMVMVNGPRDAVRQVDGLPSTRGIYFRWYLERFFGGDVVAQPAQVVGMEWESGGVYLANSHSTFVHFSGFPSFNSLPLSASPYRY